MNLDDIIEYFEKTGTLGPKGYGLAELELRTAKLLKAGKQMYDDMDTSPCYLGPGTAMWDAATKEDV